MKKLLVLLLIPFFAFSQTNPNCLIIKLPLLTEVAAQFLLLTIHLTWTIYNSPSFKILK